MNEGGYNISIKPTKTLCLNRGKCQFYKRFCCLWWLLKRTETVEFKTVTFCSNAPARPRLSNYFILYHGGDRSNLQKRSFLTKVDSVLGFYAGGLARVRGVGVNEKCLLTNPTGEPKPGYFAYQNLCALIDKSYKPIDLKSDIKVTDQGIFYGIGPHEDAFPSVPLVASFRKKNGSYLLAHWLPWHGQEYLPKLAKIDLSVDNIQFTNPVLVDLLSGKVYQIDNVTQTGSKVVFTGLPLADYPFAIIENSEIEIIKNPELDNYEFEKAHKE